MRLNRLYLGSFFVAAAVASQAATLNIHVAGYNPAKGDQVQYRLPGGNWIRVEPAYGLAKVHGVQEGIIVVARVFNTQRQQTISSQAKAVWRGSGGDMNWFGQVHFSIWGSY